MKRKLLSCVLVFALIMALVPVASFAEIITVDISDSLLISVGIDDTDLEYDGCEKTPAVTVKYGTEVIFTQKADLSTSVGSGLKDVSTPDSPSAVVFSDNIEAGTAEASVSLELEGLINGYYGSVDKTFVIKKRPVASEELFAVNCADRGKTVAQMLEDPSYKGIYDQACDELDVLIRQAAREYDGTNASDLTTAYAVFITSPKSYDLVAVDGTASFINSGVSDTAQLCFTPSEVSNAQSRNYYMASKEPTVIESKITKKTVVVAPDDITIKVNESPAFTFSAAGIEADGELSDYIAGLSSDSLIITDNNGKTIDLGLAVSVPGKYTISLKDEATATQLEKFTIKGGSAVLTVKGDTDVETADRYNMGFEAYVNGEGIAMISSIDMEKLGEVGSDGDIGYAELDFSVTGKYVTGISVTCKELQRLVTELAKNPFILGFYITTSQGSLKFDSKAISVIAAEAQIAGGERVEMGFRDLTASDLTSEQTEELSPYNGFRMFEAYAKCGTKEIADIVGNLEVIIPYKVPNGLYWYKYIMKAFEKGGKMTDKIAIYDEDKGTVSVTSDRLSCFVLAYEKCDGGYACPSYWFDDVNSGDWFHDYVDFAVSAGLMNGISTSKFSPNTPIYRGMLVTILWRLQGEPAGQFGVFSDVTPGSYYEEAIGWAASAGIVNGYDTTRFGPDDPVTREQIAAILYRYSKYNGKNVEVSASLDGFADGNTVSGYAVIEMQWAYASGLITGTTGNRLDPQGTATRAQAAAILQRYE